MIYKKLFIKIPFICLLIYFATFDAYSCTIFYISKDGEVYGGNNEDWKDPYTKMFFYPSENSKHAWVKFGWDSGFPQGGVNDQGLFWDATSASYLAMPYSEENKQFYAYPIMQKIIEECATVDEALQIVNQYYCQDQYKAQYLIGDSSGNSMIVEGDNILHNETGYQVLTNFYQSHYVDGDYPCWRFNKARQMIMSMGTLNEIFVGKILSATHQEGQYPTQYSNIYDLKRGLIYLLYYHNYEEYLKIDLQQELSKGYKSYDIPELFSMLKLTYPINGETVSPSHVNISWEGLADSEYEIIYSKFPDFAQSKSFEVTSEGFSLSKASFSYFGVLFISIILLFLLVKPGKLMGSFVILMLLFTACNKEKTVADESIGKVEVFLKNIGDLDANTTYYWKINAQRNNSSHFSTESITQTFVTAQ